MAITATKQSKTFQASATNSAAGTTTGSGVDLTTSFGVVVMLKVTNGGTGPTIACDMIVQISRDNTNWIEFARRTASAANSAESVFNVEIPASVLYARTVFSGNTAQDVTVEAYGQELQNVVSA